MRYQNYKARMMKIRKVLDFFYRFRFVFIGTAVVAVTAVLTLDLTKGSITKTSKFEINYKYGEEITFEGESFMGDVTFEFRKKGDDKWSEDTPTFVGQYEARAKSKGNHGYKYSSISSFEIVPIPATFTVRDNIIPFGEDNPSITYELLGEDKLDQYSIVYEDLTKNQTKVKVDPSSIKILNKDNIDVTSCYALTCDYKDITFQKEKINIAFKNASFVYDGEEHATDDSDYTFTGTLHYGGQIIFEQSKATSELGKHDHVHEISIIGEDGKDYTENYDITVKENSVTIEKADPVTITSNSLSKIYDSKPFEEDEFTYEVEGLLPIHTLNVDFTNTDNYNVVTNETNSFTYTITDEEGNDASGYYENIFTHFGKIDITKRSISIKADDLVTYYNNTTKSKDTYTISNGELANENQHIVVDSTTEVTKPGIYDNVQTYSIFETKVIDEVPTEVEVSDNYVINPEKGQIEITTKKLKFNFTPQEFFYDGDFHTIYENNNDALIDPEFEENLLEGWKYHVYVDDSFKMKDYSENGYKATDNDVIILLTDSEDNAIFDNTSGPDTLGNFQRSDFLIDFGDTVSRIKQLDLTVTVNDYVKDFDNKKLSDTLNVNDGVMVTSSGLIGEDYLKVDYAKASDKNIINHSDDPYQIGVNCQVKRMDGTKEVDITNNYKIKYESDKTNIEATINKIPISLSVDDYTKIYDGNNTVSPKLNVVSGGLGGEAISLDTTKKYTVTSSDADTYPLTVSSDDVRIKINNVDVTNNYIIESIAGATATINKRTVNVDQKASTVQVIYYDTQYHGVFDGSNEVLIQTQGTGVGLVSGHTLSITNGTNKEKDPGTYLYPASSYDYGIVIKDVSNNDVTSNYFINIADFRINIVKKTVKIYNQKTFSSTYDGSLYDPYSNLTFGEYYDLSNFSQAIYSVWIDEQQSQLATGHKVVITKSLESVINQTNHVGTYTNYYDYKIIDANKNDVSDQYNIEHYEGSITINPAYVTVRCNSNSKIYDGLGISDGPQASFTVTKNTANKGSYISSQTVGTNFSKNFTLTATYASTGSEEYKPGNYVFEPEYSWTESVGCNFGVDLIFTPVGSYNYRIQKRNIEIRSKTLYDNVQMRILNGVLANGDELYFGDEPFVDRIPTAYTYDLEDWKIMRGSDDVSDCYNVSLTYM